MSRRLCLFACFVAAALASPALALPSAPSLLRQMYQASGGAAWRALAGADVSGDYGSGGLKGDFRQRIDLRRGRDVLTYDLGATRGDQATQPALSWWTDDKGLTTVQDGPEALADAATQSYVDRNGWFDSAAALAESLGRKSEGGRTFDLVRVHAPGGRALTLWIDGDSHRLDRFVQLDSSQRETTTFLSDYRHVHGVWWPYAQRTTNGDAGSDTTLVVKQLDFHPVPDSAFAPPTSAPHDAALLPGPAAVPFELRGGLIVVDVAVNGGKPLPFLLDSGALNLLTPATAKALDLGSAGDITVNGVGGSAMSSQLAHVDSYRVGPAELKDQRFIVLDLPREVTSNGSGPPLAGMIGYELLRRFVVRVDYHQRTLTITLPSAGAPPQGARLPLRFDGRDSFVLARAGGAAGYFGVDTGDDGSVTLFQAFFAAHPIPVERPGIESLEGGVGGVSRSLETRIPSLTLGGFQLERPVADINFASGGAFASTLLAGNLGSQVFRNFVLTFDYPDRALYLAKSPDFGAPMIYNGTGVHIAAGDDGGVMIRSVQVGSAGARAGVEVGDRLVAVDGHAASEAAYLSVGVWFAAHAGQTLQLDLLRDGKPLHVAVTAEDLLPQDGPLRLVPPEAEPPAKP